MFKMDCSWLLMVSFLFGINVDKVTMTRLNWSQAAEECLKMNKILIEPKEYQNLTEYNANLMYNHSYWLGVRYNVELGKFLWYDGTTANYSASQWVPDEPIFLGLRPCIKISYPDHLWCTSYCNAELEYICQSVPQPVKKIVHARPQIKESFLLLLIIYICLLLLVILIYFVGNYYWVRSIKPDAFVLPIKPLKTEHCPDDVGDFN